MSDEELIAFAREFRDFMLEGRDSLRMCFMVCFPLEGLLNATDVGCRMIRGNIEGWDHVWLELDDGRILDPTADQFPNLFPDAGEKPMPAVFLGARPSWYDPTPILETSA